MIRKAKKEKIKVTAGVTPHHLFLIDKDVTKLGPFALMKPVLGTKSDQDSLWQGILDGTIDLIESDHAPHTRAEKLSINPPFGIPNLETTLGLMLKAVHSGKITEAPKKIFNIPEQANTYIELDPDKPYQVGENGYQTKCDWSPFENWELFGKVEQVVLRKKHLVINGKIV